MTVRTFTLSKILCCSGLIGIFLFPLFFAVLCNADFINLASESLAYRFFYALRTQGTPDPAAWLPQGQLASAIQSIWFFILAPNVKLDMSNLRAAMNLFGVVSLASFNLIGVVTLIMAFRSRLAKVQLGMLALFVFSILYCIKNNYGMLLWPDYYLLNVNLALAALFLFMKRRMISETPSTDVGRHFYRPHCGE